MLGETPGHARGESVNTDPLVAVPENHGVVVATPPKWKASMARSRTSFGSGGGCPVAHGTRIARFSRKVQTPHCLTRNLTLRKACLT